MKISAKFGLVATVCVAAALAVAAPYVSKPGKYSVEFPGPVQTMDNDIKTEAGPTVAHIAYANKADTVFMISYNDYPVPSIDPSKHTKVLQATLDGVCKGKTNLQFTKKGFIQTSNGKMLEAVFSYVQNGKKGYTAWRGAVKGTRLYQNLVLRYGGPMNMTDVNKFLNSFKILP